MRSCQGWGVREGGWGWQGEKELAWGLCRVGLHIFVCVCVLRCVAFFYHSMSSSLWRAVLLQIHAKSRYSPADSHMSINTPPSCDWTRVRGKGCFDLANNVVMVNALTRGHQTRRLNRIRRSIHYSTDDVNMTRCVKCLLMKTSMDAYNVNLKSWWLI